MIHQSECGRRRRGILMIVDCFRSIATYYKGIVCVVTVLYERSYIEPGVSTQILRRTLVLVLSCHQDAVEQVVCYSISINLCRRRRTYQVSRRQVAIQQSKGVRFGNDFRSDVQQILIVYRVYLSNTISVSHPVRNKLNVVLCSLGLYSRWAIRSKLNSLCNSRTYLMLAEVPIQCVFIQRVLLQYRDVDGIPSHAVARSLKVSCKGITHELSRVYVFKHRPTLIRVVAVTA